MFRKASLLLLLGMAASSVARGDTTVQQRKVWSGSVAYVTVGAPLAIDGPDADTTSVDALLPSATASVSDALVTDDARLLTAYLYWSGTVEDSSCVGATMDDTVDFTPPGGVFAAAVTADTCYCSDGDSAAFDLQVCRADVTALVDSLTGRYEVGGFAARITNDPTDNASFAVVLVLEDRNLSPQRIGLFDGIETLYSDGGDVDQRTLRLGSLKVAEGGASYSAVSWYALDGDEGGGGSEKVTATGGPGGASVGLGGADPMNHTTSVPPRLDTLGMDLDTVPAGGALADSDFELAVTFQGGSDKYWLAFGLVSTSVIEGVLHAASKQDGFVVDDADGDGGATQGDTVRYAIHLANTGLVDAVVDIDDVIPPQAASWSIVDIGGGFNASSSTKLDVRGITVKLGESIDINYELIIGAVAVDETPMPNACLYDAGGTADSGSLDAPTLNLRRDGDHDGHFDNDDNCPTVSNRDQLDLDLDGVGDACDRCEEDAANDSDADGRCAEEDNCPEAFNPTQADRDEDGVGDECDSCPDDPTNDEDFDGICEDLDNCPGVTNPDQLDGDEDGIGDMCDDCPEDAGDDGDGDGVCDDIDNCPGVTNDQSDRDGDFIGDACDDCADDADNDGDDDGVCADADNCPLDANPGQEDSDGDGTGDPCDSCPDNDLDGSCDDTDNCPGVANEDQSDRDADNLGDLCDDCPDDTSNDVDDDGICADQDNCPEVANPFQEDADGDGVGDACAACPDADFDGTCDSADNCPDQPNVNQSDSDGDGMGDACDPCPDDAANDVDEDAVCGDVDVCPTVFDPGQEDRDGDGVGDACSGTPETPDAGVDSDAGGEGGGSGGGGCAVAPGSGGHGSLLILAAFAAILYLRRRRRS